MHPMASVRTATATLKGHIWSPRLGAWVVPIQRRNSRRPSPDHVHCSEPPCWVLMRPLPPPPIGGVSPQP